MVYAQGVATLLNCRCFGSSDAPLNLEFNDTAKQKVADHISMSNNIVLGSGGRV